MVNFLGHPDTSITDTSSNPSHPPRETVKMRTDIMMFRATSFRPASGHPECLNDFAVQLQAASRTYLSKRSMRPSVPEDGRLPPLSSAPSLTCLTREARYARAESALRVALSRCETEPSPLELQVRVLEKGLQGWNTRAGRGYERVQKAEEALAAARRNEEGSVMRSSFSELQREKWMGMKERGEALAMVEKIKGLIKGLNMEIMGGLRESPHPQSVHSAPQKAPEIVEESLSCETASKKAAILFSGKFPTPYLEKLPRSRRSVEPLRLPLQITNHYCRRRSSTLQSEHATSITSSTTCTTQPPTPHPATPTDDFGAAFIHTPPPSKSVAQYLADMEDARETRRVHGHVRLPSYVGALLEELSEDRIGNKNLHISEVLQSIRPSTPCSSATSQTAISPLPNQRLKTKGSKGLLRRPFSNLSRAPSLPRSPSQYFRSKENHDPSMPLHETSIDSPAVPPEKHTLPNTTTGSLPSNSSLTSPALDINSRIHQVKSPGRVGNLIESVKRSVKKVSRRGE